MARNPHLKFYNDNRGYVTGLRHDAGIPANTKTLAEAARTRMSFDRVFPGADAVTAEYGVCEADHAQTRLKEHGPLRPRSLRAGRLVKARPAAIP